jgi:hypothetical protein
MDVFAFKNPILRQKIMPFISICITISNSYLGPTPITLSMNGNKYTATTQFSNKKMPGTKISNIPLAPPIAGILFIIYKLL